MVGYLMDYGAPISFLQWMITGMPFVPLMTMVIGAYMYIRCKPQFRVKDMNPSEVVKAEVENMPKFGGREALMAVILVLLVLMVLGDMSGSTGGGVKSLRAMLGRLGIAVPAGTSLNPKNVAAVTVALVHLLFNLSSIAIIYPIRRIRLIPVNLARRLAQARREATPRSARYF